MRYTTPNASTEWVERSAGVQDMQMEIEGFLGVQFYDFEAYFAGDITTWMIEATYSPQGQPGTNFFSGGASTNYDSKHDVTIVSGRTAMPVFAEGMNVVVHTLGENSSDITLLP